LSEPGVPASSGLIPLCVPEIRGREWEYVKECLDTNWVSSAGPFVERFEQEMAQYIGTRFAVATCSGTAALHTALLVAGVQPNDEVIVSTLTFIAPANAVRYVGAVPVFIDADPEYWQMDTYKLASFISEQCRLTGDGLINQKSGRRVTAILPVHILGHPCDMQPILEIARQNGLTVIEDAWEHSTRGPRWAIWGISPVLASTATSSSRPAAAGCS
jgi:perosamine synthetase